MFVLSAVRAVHFAFAIQSMGALLFVGILSLAPVSAPRKAADTRSRRLLRAAAVSAAAALVSAGVWVVLQAADVTATDPVETITNGALRKLLWETHAGAIWWVRFVLAVTLTIVAIVLGLAPRAPSGGAIAFAFVLAAITFISSAWLSHAAADATPYGPLHLAVHASHMFAVALWLGGLVPLAMLLSWARQSGGEEDLAIARHSSVLFGNIALFAVGFILVSGILNSALVIDRAADLTEGAFAHLLAVKLVLFLLLLVLAAKNRQQLVPRLVAGANTSSAITQLRRSVLGELALAALVLVIVGALGITPPGAGGKDD